MEFLLNDTQYLLFLSIRDSFVFTVCGPRRTLWRKSVLVLLGGFFILWIGFYLRWFFLHV